MTEVLRSRGSVHGIIIIISLFVFANADHILFDTDDCEACKIDTKSILEGYGYPAEEHMVESKDGYTLTIFRIPYGIKNTKRNGRIPVLCQHGASGISDNWVMTLDNTNDSFVTRLADSGYDVWLSNLRGTRYSHHNKYSVTEIEFWNFSLDDLTHDLEAVCKYVLETTGYPSISYAGHSLGGVYLSMFLSSRPEFNHKIHYAQLLSPVVYTTTNPVLSKMTPHGRKSLAPVLAKLLEFIFYNDLMDSIMTISTPTAKRITRVCTSNKMIYGVCIKLIGAGIGFDPLTIDHLSREKFEVFIEQNCQGLSFKQAAHLMQLSSKDQVQWFDYRTGNIEVYGTVSPPEYDLTKIDTNIKIYYPQNDQCLDIADADRFFDRLENANVSKHLMTYPRFNHYDYFFGRARFPFLDIALRDINEFHRSHFKRGANTLPGQE